MDNVDTVINEDCALGLAKLPENSIDVCITDPPYNYESIGHKWDANEVKRRMAKAKESKNVLVKTYRMGAG